MARAWISVRELEAGNVPSVCAKTGAPADTLYPMQFSSAPPWTVGLLLFGVPFRSPAAFGTRQVTGLVPLREDVHSHLATLLSSRWWTAIASLTLLLLAVATQFAGVPVSIARAFAWAGVSALGCAGVFSAFAVLRTVKARIDQDRTWVRMTGVHPRFAAAVESAYVNADLARLVRPL